MPAAGNWQSRLNNSDGCRDDIFAGHHGKRICFAFRCAPEGIAIAIGEQYETVPKTKIGLAVALADRLDSLVSLFAVGLTPSGAKDPFGLATRCDWCCSTTHRT
jgi:hypothetical protein